MVSHFTRVSIRNWKEKKGREGGEGARNTIKTFTMLWLKSVVSVKQDVDLDVDCIELVVV